MGVTHPKADEVEAKRAEADHWRVEFADGTVRETGLAAIAVLAEADEDATVIAVGDAE